MTETNQYRTDGIKNVDRLLVQAGNEQVAIDNPVITGNLEVGGNLSVDGDQTVAGNLTVVDIAVSGNGAISGTLDVGGVITSNGQPVATISGTVSNADMLDGQHGSYYLAAASYTASDVLSKVKTVDGAGSGLDSELLNGQYGSYYLNAGNATGTLPTANLPSGVIPSTPNTSSADFNTLTTAGWQSGLYPGTNANGPGDATYYYVQNLVYQSSITQIAYPYSTPNPGRIWMRGLYSGAWTAWSKLPNTSEVAMLTGASFTGQVYATTSSSFADHAISGRAGGAVWGGTAGVSQDGLSYGILGYSNAYSLYGKGTLYNTGDVRSTTYVISELGYFFGAPSQAILGTNGGSGTIYLRPNSAGSSTGQFLVLSTGVVQGSSHIYGNNGSSLLHINGDTYGSIWGGYLSSYLGANYATQTYAVNQGSAYAQAYTAGRNAGDYGSYAFAKLGTGAGFGSTAAGSALSTTDANNGSGTVLSGSWRCMGWAGANVGTLWLRYG